MTTKSDKQVFKILALPGDHIGPEILQEVLPILKVIEELSDGRYAFEITTHTFGGASIDQYGSAIRAETIEAARGSHAILLGAVGGPEWDNNERERRPEWGIFELRRIFQLFANVRPAYLISPKLLKLSPLKEDVARGANIIVVRENAGGIYYGPKTEASQATQWAFASDECGYRAEEIRRLIDVAAALAEQHDPPLAIHSVDKANAMASSRLWRHVTKTTVKEKYPHLEPGLSHHLVDSCAMLMARKPTSLNGIVLTENLFGDILSDLSAVIPGSLGLLGSGELDGAPPKKDGDRRPFGLYQPVSGSAPDISGKGIANPIGMITSVALLLRWSLGLHREADCIEEAIRQSIEEGICTGDLGGRASTSEVGEAVTVRLRALLAS